MTANCPYLEAACAGEELTGDTPACPKCRRTVKECTQCTVRNRALANFCRGCGAALPVRPGNWLGYKGGAQRLGLNSAAPRSAGTSGSPLTHTEIAIDLQLGAPCRSLLGYDGFLIAIAQSGAVGIVDPRRPSDIRRFQVSPPTCEPCIHRGVLYVGARGQLAAYSLGATTTSTPQLLPLWQAALSGAPVQALVVVDERMYLTIARGAGREVQVVERLHDRAPAAARTLYSGANVSWLAADGADVVFLTDERGGPVTLHVVDDESRTTSHILPLDSLGEHPIAALDGSVFAIFGEQQRLYRIDIASGAVAEALDADTQLFSMHNGSDIRPIRIDSDGIVFSRSGPRDTFSQHDRALRGSPLVVRDCAAAVAMRDRILIYDLAQAPAHGVWRIAGRGDAGAALTALASFDHYMAAGDDQGTVGVVALHFPGGSPQS